MISEPRKTYLRYCALWKWIVLFVTGTMGAMILYGINTVIGDKMPDNVLAKPILLFATCVVMLFFHNWLSGAFEGRKVSELSFKRLLPDLGLGMAIGATFFVVFTLLMMLFGCYRVTELHFDWSALIIAFSVFAVVAVGEEIICRALLYRMVEERWGSVIALVVSCLAFGFMHLGNDNATVWSSIAIALAATESAAYFYSKTLWLPIGIHWTWNFFQGNIFGFAVSGTDAGTSIISPSISGPDIITGGGFGPEASIIMVIISAGFSALLIYKGIKKGNFIPLKKDKRLTEEYENMRIDFDNIEETIIHNFKGGVKETAAKMYYDGLNRIMKGRLIPGASIGMHTHDTSSEIIFVTKGSGSVIYDGETISLKEGDVHYCPKGHTHSLINDSDEDLEFSAVVPQQ